MKEKKGGRTHEGIEKAKCGKAHKNKQTAGKNNDPTAGKHKSPDGTSAPKKGEEPEHMEKIHH